MVEDRPDNQKEADKGCQMKLFTDNCPEENQGKKRGDVDQIAAPCCRAAQLQGGQAEDKGDAHFKQADRGKRPQKP